MTWRPGDPRFVVREVDGYVPWTNRAPFLSVSVLDAAYCYAEVARFNQEGVKGGLRGAKGQMVGSMTATEKRAAIRARAAGLAAMLEAEHA